MPHTVDETQWCYCIGPSCPKMHYAFATKCYGKAPAPDNRAAADAAIVASPAPRGTALLAPMDPLIHHNEDAQVTEANCVPPIERGAEARAAESKAREEIRVHAEQQRAAIAVPPNGQ